MPRSCDLGRMISVSGVCVCVCGGGGGGGDWCTCACVGVEDVGERVCVCGSLILATQ